ncbi:hypothetical protein LX87_00383 [Larkinella arboricola]|uniref:Uncharacterized protein n=1 Tax=Larkinella arboricola TaxID=643671 RepID=A0A327X8P5_LARAB|nr:hypothetical protein [Larkinella arboricola]RAK02263.1 hypothetical protein LX87_00383 [Larkinella arboricola]
MKTLKISLFFALLSATVSRAQYAPLGAITSWADGYVVTTENDTIRGKVRVNTMVNDAPASIVVRLADDKKVTFKGEKLRLVAQDIPKFAYATGAIPREREQIVFERVPNPRKDGKTALLERLSHPGKITLYFDANGWKKNAEYTFGNFTIATNPKDLSFVVVKDQTNARIVKKGTFDDEHEALFGDCPAFVQRFPAATRRDWKRFGDLVESYNQTCVVGVALN